MVGIVFWIAVFRIRHFEGGKTVWAGAVAHIADYNIHQSHNLQNAGRDWAKQAKGNVIKAGPSATAPGSIIAISLYIEIFRYF